MPRFFCKPEQIIGEAITITGDDAHHMRKVLRMRVGELVTICDAQGSDFSCAVDSIEESAVILKILSQSAVIAEPKVQVTLYQGLPKSDKMEFIIQKAVELGVTRIVPMQTKFCVAKQGKKGMESKLVRYNRIAFEAAKQSGRGIIPTVEPVQSFTEALQSGNGQRILYYEHGGSKTGDVVDCKELKVSIYIGSEGGFSEDEIEQAEGCGVKIGSLGKLILRCETAPIVATTLIMSAFGEM